MPHVAVLHIPEFLPGIVAALNVLQIKNLQDCLVNQKLDGQVTQHDEGGFFQGLVHFLNEMSDALWCVHRCVRVFTMCFRCSVLSMAFMGISFRLMPLPVSMSWNLTGEGQPDYDLVRDLSESPGENREATPQSASIGHCLPLRHALRAFGVAKLEQNITAAKHGHEGSHVGEHHSCRVEVQVIVSNLEANENRDAPIAAEGDYRRPPAMFQAGEMADQCGYQRCMLDGNRNKNHDCRAANSHAVVPDLWIWICYHHCYQASHKDHAQEHDGQSNGHHMVHLLLVVVALVDKWVLARLHGLGVVLLCRLIIRLLAFRLGVLALRFSCVRCDRIPVSAQNALKISIRAACRHEHHRQPTLCCGDHQERGEETSCHVP
mmetsp:Transcript_116892/g.277692  ORF Transcript_116892/g.277692 Transcript_116892/m.277692 type:complete len:376 (-) Transcript_116892:121-1248(-)